MRILPRFEKISGRKLRPGCSSAKAVVVGVTSNGFALADPKCLRTATSGMLDVVGFDTCVPAVIWDFVRAA